MTVFTDAFLGLLAVFTFASAVSCADQNKVLVVVEDLAYRNTHSLFFSSLEDRGYGLTFKAADDKTLQLRSWDTWLYDKLIIMASGTSEFGGAVDTESILEFIDAGHDLLLAVDSRASDEIRALVAELGVDPEPRGSALMDHLDYVKGPHADHQLLPANKLVQAKSIMGTYTPTAPILYKGIAMTISPDSELASAALTALDTSICNAVAKPADTPLLGRDAVLVAAVQTRNNARAVVAGSIDLFSNDFFVTPVDFGLGGSAPVPANKGFCTKITKWAFHERGTLRAGAIRHRRADNGTWNPPFYRIQDVVDVQLDIHQLVDGAWVPYKAHDVQLELVMLDPYVRADLKHNSKGTFSTRIKVPDVYGVFKFVIDYKRLGYTSIQLSSTVPVRPFRHNEFERFLVAAYPYYTSAFSTMAAFLLLSFVFLYHK